MNVPAPRQPISVVAGKKGIISVSTGNEISKVGVLLVGKSPHMVSFLRPPLEKLGCDCHFAKSYQEISELLSRNKLDIVLSLNCYQNSSEIVPLLAGQCVSVPAAAR